MESNQTGAVADRNLRATEAPDQFIHGLFSFRIERVRGLIDEEKLRPVNESAGEHQSLMVPG